MKVFISWSGEASKTIAGILKKWLPTIIQAVQPYYTDDDLAKGARWNIEISKQLEASRIGLLCLTRENTNSPWILFEAGALAKKIGKSHVCPILFDFEPTDLTGPLVQFQAARFDRGDLKKVVEMINNELGSASIAQTVLDEAFDAGWPRLENAVRPVLANRHSAAVKSTRSDRDLLEEVLELVRRQAREGVLKGQEPAPSPILFHDYCDEKTRKLARGAILGRDDDPNGLNWTDGIQTTAAQPIDGTWYWRLFNFAHPKGKVGTAAIKSVGDKVFIVHDDAGDPFLIVAGREANRLLGRYYRLFAIYESTPWVGLIVSADRIDGSFEQGRWDFRRNTDCRK